MSLLNLPEYKNQESHYCNLKERNNIKCNTGLLLIKTSPIKDHFHLKIPILSSQSYKFHLYFSERPKLRKSMKNPGPKSGL